MQDNRVEEALQALNGVRADIKHAQKKTEVLKQSIDDGEVHRHKLEADVKLALQEKESELKSQIRNQIAVVSAELRSQKHALQMEKHAREKGDKGLSALLMLRQTSPHPRLMRMVEVDQLSAYDMAASVSTMSHSCSIASVSECQSSLE